MHAQDYDIFVHGLRQSYASFIKMVHDNCIVPEDSLLYIVTIDNLIDDFQFWDSLSVNQRRAEVFHLIDKPTLFCGTAIDITIGAVCVVPYWSRDLIPHKKRIRFCKKKDAIFFRDLNLPGWAPDYKKKMYALIDFLQNNDVEIIFEMAHLPPPRHEFYWLIVDGSIKAIYYDNKAERYRLYEADYFLNSIIPEEWLKRWYDE